MNLSLIYSVTFVLIVVFVGIYQLLVRPKSLRAGLLLVGFLGLALGVSAGFGTFIHMPIPLALAWGWFIGGWLKGLAAGAIVGAVIISPKDRSIAGSRADPDPAAAPDRGGTVLTLLDCHPYPPSPSRNISGNRLRPSYGRIASRPGWRCAFSHSWRKAACSACSWQKGSGVCSTASCQSG